MGKIWKPLRYGAKLFLVYIVSCAISKIAIMACAAAVVACVYILGMVVATVATVFGIMGEGTWLKSALSYIELGGFSDDVFPFFMRMAERYWRLFAVIGPVAYIARDRARKR